MTLPEPVTKVIAVALTAAMVAYLGMVPVWEMGRGFVRLWDDAETATSVIELQDIGHRFGQGARNERHARPGAARHRGAWRKERDGGPGPQAPGLPPGRAPRTGRGGLPARGGAEWRRERPSRCPLPVCSTWRSLREPPRLSRCTRTARFRVTPRARFITSARTRTWFPLLSGGPWTPRVREGLQEGRHDARGRCKQGAAQWP